MFEDRKKKILPRNGKVLKVGVIARISGCSKQKDVSLEDQKDHGKEVIRELYQGEVQYVVIATKGKGERLDRPELVEIEVLLRTRTLDFLVAEDLGRVVRGTAAKDLCGIAVDCGTRVLAPNDYIDTDDETWEEDVIAACRDHVGHNSHTSKRIKHKGRNRFLKFGGSIARPVFGYEVPLGVKTYDGVQKQTVWTPIIREGFEMLKRTMNRSAVAHFFNTKNIPVGKYCRRKNWSSRMVQRFYENRILGGMVGRGFMHTVKHHQSGKRVPRPNPNGPDWLFFPHLAHLDLAELDDLNATLAVQNEKLGRKASDGHNVRENVPKKRTRFPGQHGRCWYCGAHHVWGANGVTKRLMCSGSREWHCWCSVGYSGALAAERVVAAIMSAVCELDGFDEQFRSFVAAADTGVNDAVAGRLEQLRRDEIKLDAAKEGLKKMIDAYDGSSSLLVDQLKRHDLEESRLARERRELDGLRSRALVLPASTAELRALAEKELNGLILDSFDATPLLNLLVPEFYVYLVQFCNDQEVYPRARVTLALDALVPDAANVPGLSALLRRTVTIDLFDPPQRERIRTEAVRLNDGTRTQNQIAALIAEKPTGTAVGDAIRLQRAMNEQGLTSPYVILEEPPANAPLRRHKNSKYVFTPVAGYQRPPL